MNADGFVKAPELLRNDIPFRLQTPVLTLSHCRPHKAFGRGVMSDMKKIFLAAAVVFVLCLGVTAAPSGTTPVIPHKTTPAGPSAVPGAVMPGQPADSGPVDIHDIRDPVQVGVNPAIFYWTAGGLAVLVVAGLLWWLIRRRKKRLGNEVPDVSAAVFKTPEEEALEGLALLETTPPDQPAMFYFRLSAVFRRFLQRRFDIDAPEMTTEELLPRLAGLEFDREIHNGLRSFLRFGDQVKFARELPEHKEMMKHLSLVKNIVNSPNVVESTAEAGGDA